MLDRAGKIIPSCDCLAINGDNAITFLDAHLRGWRFGFYRSDYGKGIAGALVVAAVALVLELAAALAQRAATPPGVGSPDRVGDMSEDSRTLSTAAGSAGR